MFQKNQFKLTAATLACLVCAPVISAELNRAELRRSSPSFVAQVQTGKIGPDEKLESFSATPVYRGKFEGSVTTSTRFNEEGQAILRLNSIYPIPDSGVSFLVELKTNKGVSKQEVVFKPDSEARIVKIKTEVPASAVKQVRKNLYNQATVKVEPGMNLRRLAMRYSRSSKGEKYLPTVAQSMAVIFIHNPDSFDNRNPDKMMKGFEINIPSQTTLMSFPHDKAMAFLERARTRAISNEQITTAKSMMISNQQKTVASEAGSNLKGQAKAKPTQIVQENKPATVQKPNKGVSELRLVDQTTEPVVPDNREELAKTIALSTEKDKLLNKNPEDVSSAKKAFSAFEEKVAKSEGISSLRADENINLLKGNDSSEEKTPVFIDSKTQDYGPEYSEEKPSDNQSQKSEIVDKNIEIVQSEDQVKYQYADKIEISDEKSLKKEETKKEDEFTEIVKSSFEENKVYILALAAIILSSLLGLVGFVYAKRRKEKEEEENQVSSSFSNALDKTPSSFQAASSAFSMGLKDATSRVMNEPTLGSLEQPEIEEDEESFSMVDKQKVNDSVEVASLKDRFMLDRKVIQREELEYGYDVPPAPVAQEPVVQKVSVAEPTASQPLVEPEPLLKEFVKEPADAVQTAKSPEITPEQEAKELSKLMFGSESLSAVGQEKKALEQSELPKVLGTQNSGSVELDFKQTEVQMRKEGASDQDLGIQQDGSDVLAELQALGGEVDPKQPDDDLDTRIELANAYIEMEDFDSAVNLMKNMKIADKSKLNPAQLESIRKVLETIKKRGV